MTLLPASTNAAYAGSRFSAWLLALLSLFSIGAGCIHYSCPTAAP